MRVLSILHNVVRMPNKAIHPTLVPRAVDGGVKHPSYK